MGGEGGVLGILGHIYIYIYIVIYSYIYIFPIKSHSPIILHIPKGLVNIGYISQDILPRYSHEIDQEMGVTWHCAGKIVMVLDPVRIGLAPGRIVTKKVRLHTIIIIIIIIIITIFDYYCHFLNHHHVCFIVIVNYRYCC